MEHPDRLITPVLVMGLSWSSTELVPFNVCNNAFTQGKHGPSLLVLPKRCCWAQITSQFMRDPSQFMQDPSQFMQDQGRGDLVTEHMVFRLAGSAGVGLYKRQWHVVPCTFTQLGKAGSSAEQVLMQEMMAKSSVKQVYLCDKPECIGGQQPEPCKDRGIGA